MSDESKVTPIGIPIPEPMEWMTADDKKLFQRIVHEMIDGGFTDFWPAIDSAQIYCLVAEMRTAARCWQDIQGKNDEGSVYARIIAGNLWLACTSAQSLMLTPEAQRRLWESLNVRFTSTDYDEEEAKLLLKRRGAKIDGAD